MGTNIELLTEKGSNSSERVEWVLRYKNLPFKWTKCPDDPGDDYKRINPLMRIPSLIVDGEPLSESMAMIELLEEMNPTPAVLPQLWWDRAKVREICEIINTTIHPVQNSKVAGFFIPEISKSEARPYRSKWIGENLKLLEPLLFRKSQFAYGESFSAADVFVAPIFRKGLELGLFSGEYPAYLNHLRHCCSIEAIRLSCPFDLQALTR